MSEGIIKVVERYKINFEEIKNYFCEKVYAFGFYRKNRNFILIFDIRKNKNDKYKYWYTCNRGFYEHNNNLSDTYDECYNNLIEALHKVPHNQPNVTSIDIDYITDGMQRGWDLLNITDEFPVINNLFNNPDEAFVSY